jgi:hypothetical protein
MQKGKTSKMRQQHVDHKCVLASKLLEQHAFRTQASMDPPHTMLGIEAGTHKEEESLSWHLLLLWDYY